jgi:hypothetical protein
VEGGRVARMEWGRGLSGFRASGPLQPFPLKAR